MNEADTRLSPELSAVDAAAIAYRERSDRRAAGAFYTPEPLAEYAARWALIEADVEQRILDPACGDGSLLAAAMRRATELQPGLLSDTDARLCWAQRNLFGVDRDADACEAARTRIAQLALGENAAAESVRAAARKFHDNIVCGDALLDGLLAADSFDVVVANPPFVNIRRLARAYSPRQLDALRRSHKTAVGNFDLYVLFVERALHWLRPQGRASFITPNKLATLRYAENCRRLLTERTTIESVLDATNIKWFHGADVYPYVWVFRNRPAGRNHQVAVRKLMDERQLGDGLEGAVESSVGQDSLSPDGFVFQGDLRVEQRVPTRRLDEFGALHSGASGFTAKRWLDHLVDNGPAVEDDADEGWEFIVSGNIDRYAIQLGDVRYLKHRFERPRLQRTCALTERKRKLYDGQKIVVAGMGRRLEAASDNAGLALGVQVYALAEFGNEGEYLIGLLNSKLMSYLFRIRFAAKRLAGGYLAVNKGQLAQLPIVQPEGEKLCSLRRRLIHAVRRRQDCGPDQQARWDAVIDRLTYRLYGLTAEEVAQVEAAVA